jgi:hypothetical protein
MTPSPASSTSFSCSPIPSGRLGPVLPEGTRRTRPTDVPATSSPSPRSHPEALTGAAQLVLSRGGWRPRDPPPAEVRRRTLCEARPTRKKNIALTNDDALCRFRLGDCPGPGARHSATRVGLAAGQRAHCPVCCRDCWAYSPHGPGRSAGTAPWWADGMGSPGLRRPESQSRSRPAGRRDPSGNRSSSPASALRTDAKTGHRIHQVDSTSYPGSRAAGTRQFNEQYGGNRLIPPPGMHDHRASELGKRRVGRI